MRIIGFTLALLLAGAARAQTIAPFYPGELDPRGEPELVVCTQNMNNFGLLPDVQQRNPRIGTEELTEKIRSLASRIRAAKCDVIAMQELLGSEERAAEGLKALTAELRQNSGRIFTAEVAPSNDKFSRNGFLIADDRAQVLSKLSFRKVELPKLTEKQKPRLFIRGPFEIQLAVKPRGDSQPKSVSLVTFHFKSKRGAAGDPAALAYETYRMEMAEGLRRIVANRHPDAFTGGERILVVLGDRNSHFDAASARILEGQLSLKHFQEGGPCRLNKRGVPLCQPGVGTSAKLFSVLTSDPQTKTLPGTFRMNSEYSWLDEILLPQESLRFAWTRPSSEGDFASGTVSSYPEASDHSMAFVALNW